MWRKQSGIPEKLRKSRDEFYKRKKMKKLRLNKEVISNISKNEMNNLKGGYQELFNSHVLCHLDQTGPSCLICWSKDCTYGPN